MHARPERAASSIGMKTMFAIVTLLAGCSSAPPDPPPPGPACTPGSWYCLVADGGLQPTAPGIGCLGPYYLCPGGD